MGTDSQPRTDGEATAGRTTAFVQDEYGSAAVLRRKRVQTPAVGPDEVLVDVRAAGVNPADWHLMRGIPYILRLQYGLRGPATPVRGLDVAGEVVAVGAAVTQFRPGDAVFGEGSGTFADRAVCPAETLIEKPAGVSFEAAAAVPVAGTTALQGLRDHGRVRAGQSVLINGASGGVGTFAVQVARSFGAEVTGVCSTRNVELVGSLGATEVIDYTTTDVASRGDRYDVVFDLVGNRSLADLRGVLSPTGRLVLSGASDGRWLGPLPTLLRAAVIDRVASHRLAGFVSSVTVADLQVLAGLLESGELEPVVDRTYPFARVPAAIDYVERGHARGKVVVTV